ncbi:hypothetical protein I6A84_21200 [Frankia sp. CNm7]|uniref:Uncharacterized protein n=1 Tax=Frankia nepalensis TaxID=1836974 RepID=A0A937UUA0_9ACTN|nr:hypothetical protein [Frankia nepalensis]MBL7514508.1 hypothetical protein [Frankia nepalensis]MBL7520536.1 hypothetical protein [Frankia nepalensis]MBL7632040.1 hypothetical protein [Frankia nepalensis]
MCIANPRRSGITAISPDGQVPREFVTPGPDTYVTNICFGGHLLRRPGRRHRVRLLGRTGSSLLPPVALARPSSQLRALSADAGPDTARLLAIRLRGQCSVDGSGSNSVVTRSHRTPQPRACRVCRISARLEMSPWRSRDSETITRHLVRSCSPPAASTAPANRRSPPNSSQSPVDGVSGGLMSRSRRTASPDVQPILQLRTETMGWSPVRPWKAPLHVRQRRACQGGKALMVRIARDVGTGLPGPRPGPKGRRAAAAVLRRVTGGTSWSARMRPRVG